MSKIITTILAHSYQNALAAHCDNERCAASLDRLIRVREIQLRAAKHYGVPTMKGVRA